MDGFRCHLKTVGLGVGQETVLRLQPSAVLSADCREVDNYMGLLLGNGHNTISAKTELFWGIQHLFFPL